MRRIEFAGYALTSCVAATMLAACGGQTLRQAQDVPLTPSVAGPSAAFTAEQAHPVARGFGTVFAMTKSGKVTVLHTFGGGSGDGSKPYAGLIDVSGTLYGTTRRGGTHHRGTVFGIAASGAETVLHSFGGLGDSEDPLAGLVNVKGTLYGTTLRGGAYDDGTRFFDHTIRYRHRAPQLQRLAARRHIPGREAP
jgi:uncharacterized repeat protein (TIGR03803 family)